MKKFLWRSFLLLLVLVCLAAGLVLYKGREYASSLESTHSLESLVAQVQAEPDYVPFEQLPDFLVNATVSIEDRRFYEHGGVDYIGLARAVLSQFMPDMLTSGGSTISQQTVKNLYGLFDTGLVRKAAEFYLADQLNDLLSKQELFALYVNIINYGDGHIGIWEASVGYFGVYPWQLSDGQCAILAGIPNSPANLELSDHYEAARERELLVLQAMVREGYISEEEAVSVYSAGVY